MIIPPGHTQDSVLRAIDKAVTVLAPSFIFGCYGIDDIRQQGHVYAIEVLAKETYEPGRPLENYLYTHIRNRLINLKRDKLRRTDAPCKPCHAGTPCGPDGDLCKKYVEWFNRNRAKANLMRPLDLTNISDEREKRTRTQPTAYEDAATAELKRMVDEHLPVELRADYLKILAGVSVPKPRREEIERCVRTILKGDVE